MPQVSLRSLLVVCLLALVVAPATVAMWWMSHRASSAIDSQATVALNETARQGKAGIEAHLAQAQHALDGLVPESAKGIFPAQSLAWVSDPALFAPMAFSLVRASPDLRFIYYRTQEGGLHGVENAADGFSFMGRTAIDGGARAVVLLPPYGPLKSAGSAGESPDPRGQPWHTRVMLANGRMFSPVSAYPVSRQLVVTLSQPLRNAAGTLTGVIGADLSLRRLPTLLKQRMGIQGMVLFLVDEQGYVLASTEETAEVGNTTPGGVLARPVLKTPHDGSALVRASYLAVEKRIAQPADPAGTSVLVNSYQSAAGPYFVTHVRVGEAQGLNWALIAAAPQSAFVSMSDNSLPGFGAWAAWAVLGLVLVIGLSRYLESNLAWTRRAADQLAHGFVPAPRGTTLVREFNQLAARLRNAGTVLHGPQFEAIRNVWQAAGRRTEEGPTIKELQDLLAARTTELADARDLAQVAIRSKAAFLTVISHELRTPLNGVIGMGNLLANTALNDEQRDFLDSLFVSGYHLQAVVDEILEFSGTESGEIVLQIAPFEVRAVVDHACSLVAKAAQTKGLKLNVDVPAKVRRGDGAEVPWLVLGDAERLQQVISELVVNAVKFTDTGRVLVRVRPLQGANGNDVPMLEVQVTDTGVGIAADQFGDVFSAFTQLESGGDRRPGGAGLGLATCRRLVELMGGQLELQSEPGSGSTFRFTALAPWTGTNMVNRVLPLDQPQQAELFQQKSRNKVRVLVVDDNAINLKVAGAMLTKFGYEALTADGGQAGLDKIAAMAASGEHLGAVLMDVHMPRVDGIQACRVILETYGDKAPPIIALTAGHSREDRTRCLEAGMVEYLTKPLQMAALLESLERWVGQPGPPTGVRADIQNEPATSVSEKPARMEQPELDSGAALASFIRLHPSVPMGLIDFSRLNEFKEFDDDQLSMTREVIGLLVSEVPLQLRAIESAISHNDIKALSAAAHSLRGAASNVGAVTLQHLCSVLERGTFEAQAIPADALACVVALRVAWNRTLPLLKEWR